jgi:hypothetical protein
LIFVSGMLLAQTASAPVQDEKTAVAIGEAALIPVYGERQIRSEEPFTAKLDGDVWMVSGTLYCADNNGHRTTKNCEGGTAVVRVSKKDGRILSMTHYK